MELSASEHIVDGLVFDASLTLSRLEIIAASGANISSSASTLLEVRAGSPPVKLQGLELDGQVIIEGGTVEVPVEIAGCRFRSSSARPGRRRLAAGTTMRALLVSDGHVSISDTFFEDLLDGAIEVSGGALAVHASVFARNKAERGSALLITGGKVVVDNSNFTGNRATDKIGGGAIHVEGTNVSLELANKTMITGSKDQGGSVVSDVRWQYSLPAPLAHYVLDPAGRIQYPYEGDREGVAENEAGRYNYDYPAQCGATLH